MNDSDDPREREIIDAFLEAAGQPELLPSALQKLAKLLNSDGCILKEGPASSFAPVCSPSMDPILGPSIRGFTIAGLRDS